jgi:hypothetical protein
MAKKTVTRELSAAERSLLSKKVNTCATEQVLAAAHADKASGLKKEIRVTLDAGGLKVWETAEAFARIDEKTTRKADADAVEEIRKMVDPADFELICPRKVDLKALDEVVGHHRYPRLAEVLKTGKSSSFTVGQLAG